MASRGNDRYTGATTTFRPVTSAHRFSGTAARIALPVLHPHAQVLELGTIEDTAGLTEHLVFLLLDVVLDVLFHDHCLRAPRLVVDRQALQLAHQGADNVVLLACLENDVLRLGCLFQLWVEDLLLDDLVHGQLALDRGEQPFAGLDSAFSRRLELGQQSLDLVDGPC